MPSPITTTFAEAEERKVFWTSDKMTITLTTPRTATFKQSQQLAPVKSQPYDGLLMPEPTAPNRTKQERVHEVRYLKCIIFSYTSKRDWRNEPAVPEDDIDDKLQCRRPRRETDVDMFSERGSDSGSDSFSDRSESSTST